MSEIDILTKSTECKNISTLKKVYEGDSSYYLLMKYYEKGDIKGLIASGTRLSEPQLRLALA